MTPRTPSFSARTPRVDAHHHLWHYDTERFGWINDQMTALRRDFGPDDLVPLMEASGIDAAITVQAQQNVEETDWLLDLAEATPAIWGVVGWLPLMDDAVSERLDKLSERAALVGLREIVQTEAAGFLDREDFNRGIAELTRRDLTYDILIRRDQLEEATRFVDRHPNQRFVLDHLAKPNIAGAEIEPWRTQLFDLAQRKNVWCKVSGMVTEADWSRWTLDDLRPYLDAAAEAFGVERLMAGSDWPVCLVAASYATWWETLDAYLARFSDEERTRILGLNALGFYQTQPLRYR
jgi:L-fuconolactonase